MGCSFSSNLFSRLQFVPYRGCSLIVRTNYVNVHVSLCKGSVFISFIWKSMHISPLLFTLLVLDRTNCWMLKHCQVPAHLCPLWWSPGHTVPFHSYSIAIFMKKILSHISVSCIHNAFIKQICIELAGICAAVQQNYHLLDENSSEKKMTRGCSLL
jgi:hypothetical protein